jgi:DNA adenine methylase
MMTSSTTLNLPVRERSPGKALEPFLKWAGGKRWLCLHYRYLFPDHYEAYFEPFLGSGAVFFSLRPRQAHLADQNLELVKTYNAIKTRSEDVLKELQIHANNHSDEYYYTARSTQPIGDVEIAARFLYLNRTCWNGLYRVNRDGIFNVPRGTKNQIINPTENLAEIGATLQGAIISHADFAKTIEMAKRGDFVFVDPPYTVAHNLNGFVKYNDKIFTWDDQIRLRDSVKSAAERGAYLLITNADHQSVRELYAGIGRHVTLTRATVISGKNIGRKETTELAIVVGY